MMRLRSPMLVLVALVALNAVCISPAAAEPGQTDETTVLIVEYQDNSVVDAAANSVSVAAKPQASVEAILAAESRGAADHRKQAIANIAAESVMMAPAVAVLTTSVALAAIGSGVNITGLTNYHTVLNGAAIKTASLADAETLKEQLQNNPAVKHVWYAGTQSLLEPVRVRRDASAQQHSKSDVTSLATRLSQVRSSHPALDGSGVLVCMIDTGIAYKNDLYGDCSSLNRPKRTCKVVSGYNFVGDGYTGTRQGPPPVASQQPTDCMGHGSMVASVAGTRYGVAPGIHLGSYRVFGCEGYVTDNVVLEAIDRAVRDGCDIINLSLASGSGYAETSPYTRVMANAISKGVLVTKAAGNAGTDGPFRADVATAVGAITIASVDVSGSRKPQVSMSSFSSYGPDPTLELLPHIAAPGGDVSLHDMYGQRQLASGTSFAAPYVAGVLALWLQYKQLHAEEYGQKLEPSMVSQQAAMKSLVATSKPVRDSANSNFVEPVAWAGAGLLDVEGLMKNQLQVDPLSIQLPSALEGPNTQTISVVWRGPPSRDGKVTYKLVHEPAASISLSDGWYGTTASIKKTYVASHLIFSQDTVTVNTKRAQPTQIKVTFSLPPSLRGSPLLYSGLIRLEAQDGSDIPSISIPYQGHAAPWSSLRLRARPSEQLHASSSKELRTIANALCYSPYEVPGFLNEVMDHLAVVPDVCTGGIARAADTVVPVSLKVLQASPECSLRVTLAPEVPFKRLLLKLLSSEGQVLGSLEPLVPTTGGGLAKMMQVMSYCTRFNGSYKDKEGKLRWVEYESKYRLRAVLEGPVAAADAPQDVEPFREEVPINGQFWVSDTAAGIAAVPSVPRQQAQQQQVATTAAKAPTPKA